MQTLRLVGDNMAWLLRSMTAAREAGVVPYEREVRVKTNFYKPEADPNVQGEGSAPHPLFFYILHGISKKTSGAALGCSRCFCTYSAEIM